MLAWNVMLRRIFGFRYHVTWGRGTSALVGNRMGALVGVRSVQFRFGNP